MRERKNGPDQQTQQKREADEPASAGARKKQVGQKAVKDKNDDEAEKDGLRGVFDDPAGLRKNRVGEQKADRGGEKLLQQSEGKSGALVIEAEARLDLVLEKFDVLLELAGEKFAALGVKTRSIGADDEQRDEQQNG